MSQSMNQLIRPTPDLTSQHKLLVLKLILHKVQLLQLSPSLQHPDPAHPKVNNLTNNRILRSNKRNNKHSKLKSK